MFGESDAVPYPTYPVNVLFLLISYLSQLIVNFKEF